MGPHSVAMLLLSSDQCIHCQEGLHVGPVHWVLATKEEILAYDDVEAAVAMSSAVLVLLSPGLDATLIAKSHSLQCHTHRHGHGAHHDLMACTT